MIEDDQTGVRSEVLQWWNSLFPASDPSENRTGDSEVIFTSEIMDVVTVLTGGGFTYYSLSLSSLPV